MEIMVTGRRSTTDAWATAHLVGLGDLPKLSRDQIEVAEKMGLPIEEYTRSFYAEELSRPQLAQKAKAAGSLVESLARALVPEARVEQVRLETYNGFLVLKGSCGAAPFTLRVEESLVDDIMDSGSPEPLEKLARIVQFSVVPQSCRPGHA